MYDPLINMFLVPPKYNQSLGLVGIASFRRRINRGGRRRIIVIHVAVNFLGRNVHWVTLYQIPSSHVDWLNNMAARGRGYFALYDHSENLKNLLLRKCFADIQIIL